MHKAPRVAMIHPMIVTLPTAASEAGSRNMPEPMMLLATMAVAGAGPILRLPIIRITPLLPRIRPLLSDRSTMSAAFDPRLHPAPVATDEDGHSLPAWIYHDRDF